VTRYKRKVPDVTPFRVGAAHLNRINVAEALTPTPPVSISDAVIELRLLRVLEAGDTDSRTAETHFLARVPEIRYAIHRRSDGLRVGRVHLRVTNDQEFLRAVGHGGYAVDEDHRRKGYAVRAVQLITALARQYRIAPLWILIEPDNVASRRTVERAGFRLLDEIDTAIEAVGLGLGPRMCCYIIDQP
jgi:predicted acetyltransferase